MTWWEYVERVTGGAMKQSEIAERVGVNQGTISRWKRGGSAPSADNAIDFARTFGVSPLEALYQAGLLRKDELGEIVEIMTDSSHAISSTELVHEIATRLGVSLEGRRGA